MSATTFPEPTPGCGLADLPTPALLVDRSRLQRNIDQVAGTLARRGIALRPHTKTSKSWEVVRRQLDAGAIGMTCSTPAEVAWLSAAGVRGLLWAHLPVGAAKVELAVRMAADHGVIVAVDSWEVARPLGEAAAAAGTVLDCLIEVDTGQGRAGVGPREVVALADRIATLTALRIRGVMTHEGHLSGFGTDRPGLDAAGHRVGAELAAVADRLRAHGHPIEIVSVGSTPGLASAPYSRGVTEARPGTYVYYDANQWRLGSATLEQCALSVLAVVVSAHPGRDVIIDAGLKAMSSDALLPDRGAGVVCDPDLVPLPDVEFWNANEEHGFLRGQGTAGLAVGDRVRIIPNHACGTENMWSRFHLIEAGRFLGVHAIEARH